MVRRRCGLKKSEGYSLLGVGRNSWHLTVIRWFLSAVIVMGGTRLATVHYTLTLPP